MEGRRCFIDHGIGRANLWSGGTVRTVAAGGGDQFFPFDSCCWCRGLRRWCPSHLIELARRERNRTSVLASHDEHHPEEGVLAAG
jgi:hypothetical protein